MDGMPGRTKKSAVSNSSSVVLTSAEKSPVGGNFPPSHAVTQSPATGSVT